MMDKVERKMSVGHIESSALYIVAAIFVAVQCGTVECHLSGFNVEGLLD